MYLRESPWDRLSHRIYSEFKLRQTKRRGVRKNTTRRRGYRKLQRSARAPTRAFRQCIHYLATLETAGWNIAILPRPSLPRSMSVERAHANIICESSVFRPGPRDTVGSVRARGIYKVERRNGAMARRREEGRVRLVLAQMDHCSRRWFDDHPRPNKTIETPGIYDVGPRPGSVV